MYFIRNKLFPTSSTISLLIHSSALTSGLKMESVLQPPEIVRGITDLNKNLFDKEIQVACLALTGVKVSEILPVIRKYLLILYNFKPVQQAGGRAVNIFLNPERIKDWSSFPSDVQDNLHSLKVSESNLENRTVTLKYEQFSAENVFRAVMPIDKEGTSSFTKIGHIVHVNLREHLLPYKTVIGEVLLDKVPGCRTVVNKVDIIDNTYRNFKMELLKGEDDMVTTVRENNCMFKFDFSTVYWNSRLCTEHERIIDRLKPDDVLFDVFAGVGPFSLPAAKEKCYVYANDLNPEAYRWLNHNAKANKIDDEYFKSFNKDGRDFIKEDIKELLPKYLESEKNIYITMNLPALAVEFLDSFVGLLDEDELPEFTQPPTLYVYCFAKGEDYVSIARNLVIDNFGVDVANKITDIFKVRTVSSLKEMMRVTVRLDRDILVGDVPSKKRKLEDGLESANKKFDAGGESVQFAVLEMGKNKKKINSVFKVAGAKSLRLKAKAKAVKSELKNIKNKTKLKTVEIDKALVQLEDKIRKTTVPEQKSPQEKPKSKLPTINNEKSLETQEKCNEAAADLNQMQL